MKRARRDEIGPSQESANTGGAPSSSVGADVEMQSRSAWPKHVRKRWRGSKSPRLTKRCVSRTGRKPICCRWRDINKGDSERVEVRSRSFERETKEKGTDSYFVGTPPFALVRYVISGTATLSWYSTPNEPVLHADVLTETFVKPPHLRDTERCWLLICTARFLQQQDGNILFRESVQTLACSAQAIVNVRLDTHPEIWTWSCMVTISSSLDVVSISIGCPRN